MAMRRSLWRLQSFSGDPLKDVAVTKIRAMEKDLYVLEHEIAKSVKKQDLNRLKQKWGLKTDTFGSQISPQAARQALAAELQEEIRQLGGSAGEAHGSVVQAVAASRPQATLPKPAAPQASGRPLALAAGSAAVGLGVYWIWAREPPPLRVSDEQANAAVGSEKAPEERMVEKPEKATAQEPTVSIEKPTVPTEPEQKPPAVDTEAKPSGALHLPGTSLVLDPLAVAAVSVAVLGIGLWWMWRPHGGPPSPPQDVPVDVPVADAPGLADASARQAGEVIFENAPKAGQVWDMTASVRGIQGGVQEKISRFEG